MVNELLYAIDPNTMILGLVFIILYIIIHFSLAKIFRNDRASSVILSLCISLLAVYGLNRTTWNFSNFFFDLGITEDIFYIVVPWIILGLAVLASFAKDNITGKKKFKLYRLFLALGLMIFLIGLTPVYQKNTFLIIGVILLILGIVLGILQFRGGREGELRSPRTRAHKNSKHPRIYRTKSKLPLVLILLGVVAIIAGSILGFAPATYLLIGIILIVLGLVIFPILRFIGLSAGI
jgi:hypothetical protein